MRISHKLFGDCILLTPMNSHGFVQVQSEVTRDISFIHFSQIQFDSELELKQAIGLSAKDHKSQQGELL
jgi:hypothetical protein